MPFKFSGPNAPDLIRGSRNPMLMRWKGAPLAWKFAKVTPLP